MHNKFLKNLCWLLLLGGRVIHLPSSEASCLSTFPNRDDTHAVKYMLLSKDKLLVGNEALIIADIQEIQELGVLLRENERLPHACGYHWSLRFQYNLRDAFVYRYNQECEQYHSHNDIIHQKFHAYIAQIMKVPSHYLYNLTIDASYDPDVVAAQLMQRENTYIMFDELGSYLPSFRLRGEATVSYSSNRPENEREALEMAERFAREKLQNASLLIKEKYHPVRIDAPKLAATHLGKMEVGKAFEMTIYFERNQEISGLETLLPNVEIVELKKPLDYYTSLLATPTQLSVEEIWNLKEQFHFIREVIPFNSGR